MILAVCLNAAIDVTYRIGRLTPGESHRVDRVHERAGGKGINVARVLQQLAEPVRVSGFAGGATGASIADDLQRAGIAHELTAKVNRSRRTVTVVDDDRATVLNEPGGPVTASEWHSFVADFGRLVRDAAVVVLAGSVPPGIPDDGYAQLTQLAHLAGAAVIIDAEGTQLSRALTAQPELAKPNAAEAARLLGRAVRTREDALAAAGSLVAAGARTALVSLGSAGFVAAGPAGALSVRLSQTVGGNPTGAGDALAAVLARGLTRSASWPDVLVEAAAVSAAAVASSTAGCFDAAVADALRPGVIVEEI